MTALCIGVAGTLLFLLLTFLSFFNQRFKSLVRFWKYPAFVLPLAVFAGILASKLYIPFKGAGCSYAENQGIIEPETFSSDKRTGVLMFFLDGFEDCRVTVTMDNGKSYSGKSLGNIFAIVLPADSGKVSGLRIGKNADTVQVKMDFRIVPGKLTYTGTITGPKGIAQFIPALAGRSADFTYKTPADVHRRLLKKWAQTNRLVLTAALQECMAQLRKNNQTASQFVGVQFGYLPFSVTSMKGKIQYLSPNEIVREYRDYRFMIEPDSDH